MYNLIEAVNLEKHKLKLCFNVSLHQKSFFSKNSSSTYKKQFGISHSPWLFLVQVYPCNIKMFKAVVVIQLTVYSTLC